MVGVLGLALLGEVTIGLVACVRKCTFVCIL